MRSLWLASAATIFIAGAALAQTTGPAPTGAPNGATVTGPGKSPGNAGTSAPTSGGTTAPAAALDNSGTPAKNPSGAPNGATVTAPGASSGKTQSAASPTTPMSAPKPKVASTTMVHHYHHYYGSGVMTMPVNGTATTYLGIAKTATAHRNRAMAQEALARAETDLLNRTVPQGQIASDSSPAISSIEGANTAITHGNMTTASHDIDMAMSQAGGEGGATAMPASIHAGSASPLAGSFKSEAMPIAKDVPARVGAASQHPENLGTTPAEGGTPEEPNTH